MLGGEKSHTVRCGGKEMEQRGHVAYPQVVAT